MKRYRVKAVGFGLALWAGYLHAGDDPQPAATNPAPAVLPAAVRASDWATASPGDGDALWLPARKPAEARVAAPKVSALPPALPPITPVAVSPVAAPAVVLPAIPSVAPSVVPLVVPAAIAPVSRTSEPEPESVGPRSGATIGGLGALPEIPTIPAATASPDIPATLPAPAPPEQPRSASAEPKDGQPLPLPLPSSVSAETPPGVALPPIPSVPAGAEPLPSAMPARPPMADQLPVRQPDPLPTPRPVTPPPIPPAANGTWNPLTAPPGQGIGGELPTAPPELMVPPGAVVPGNHGTFGSAPVRISRDYPPLRELVRHDDGGWWGRSAGDPDGDGSSPATDRFYYRTELLLWWVRPQQIPVLGTTSVNGGLGFLGDPGTRTLLGPGSFGDSLRVGTRQRAGWWFDDCGTCGIDGSFFFLGRQTTSAAFNSGTFPTITRPIFAPNFNAEFGEIVALPNFSTGTLAVDATSALWGFDANLRHALCKTCDYRSEVFAGYRFLGLNESLRVTEFITALPGNPNDPAGTRVVVQDQFATKNRFNGGQVGYAAERNWGRFSLDGRGSIALGDTYQTIDITGTQSRLRPGMTTPDTFTGGLLATGPNLGHFTRDKFSVVPEVMINAGYWLTPSIKAYFGYNFLYWSNVVRPGDQIDRVVDVTLVPNPPPGVGPSGQLRPHVPFAQSDLWVNGIQFGLMGRW